MTLAGYTRYEWEQHRSLVCAPSTLYPFLEWIMWLTSFIVGAVELHAARRHHQSGADDVVQSLFAGKIPFSLCVDSEELRS